LSLGSFPSADEFGPPFQLLDQPDPPTTEHGGGAESKRTCGFPARGGGEMAGRREVPRLRFRFWQRTFD